MESFFGLINNPAVPWVLAVGIMVLAITMWVMFRWRLSQFFHQIHSARQILAQHPKEQIIAHYEELNEQLAQLRWFEHQWEAFRQTLILPFRANEPIFYTVRPSQFFNLHSVVAPRINLSLFQAAPNIFVGIGLFFTFIGLVAALWFASEGVAAPDVEKAQQALRDLLHAATFKFITSIAGLLASLIFSWREKSQIHRVQEQLHRFCEELEARFDFTTQEQLVVKQVRESVKQTEQLERFNSELAVSIANALEDTFTEKLIAALKPLSTSLNGLVEKVGGMNQKALEKMMHEFSEKLQGAAGEEMRQLASALQELVPTLSELRQKFDSSSLDFGTRMGEAAQALQSGLSQATDSLIDHMTTTNAQLQASTAAEMEKIGEPLAQLAASLERLKVGLDESSASLKNRLQDASQDAANNLTLAGDKLQHHITESSQTLNAGLVTAHEQFSSAKDALSEVLKQSQDTYQKSLKQLQAVNTGLNTTAESLQGISDPVVKAAHSLAETVVEVKELSSSVTSASQALQNSNQTVTQVWQKYQGHFEKVDEDVAKVFQELTNGMENYRQQVENFTSRLDDSLNQAVKSLSSVIVELVEAVEDLQSKK